METNIGKEKYLETIPRERSQEPLRSFFQIFWINFNDFYGLKRTQKTFLILTNGQFELLHAIRP